MSLALARGSEFGKYRLVSMWHPDNVNRPLKEPLPVPVRGPAPLVSFNQMETQIDKAWGHRLMAEKPFGPGETCLRIKATVSPKIGQTWSKTITIEQGISTSCSAMYGGSCVQMSCRQAADKVRRPAMRPTSRGRRAATCSLPPCSDRPSCVSTGRRLLEKDVDFQCWQPAGAASPFSFLVKTDEAGGPKAPVVQLHSHVLMILRPSTPLRIAKWSSVPVSRSLPCRQCSTLVFSPAGQHGTARTPAPHELYAPAGQTVRRRPDGSILFRLYSTLYTALG
jgi:hypothetical protein